jgi:1-acyl-sn-glycerol-3-phosphate acyltransferase
MRFFLAPLRVVLLVAHILDGLVISGLAFPWLAQANRNRIIRWWSRVMLWLCSARLEVTNGHGAPLDATLLSTGIVANGHGRLLLINHISWIDVYAILGTLPSRFVAKAEIARWPVIGKRVALVGTLFIERGRRHAVHAMNHQVLAHLRAGECVAVFPEGTTTDGTALLPFHSNLIAPALELGAEVWPIVLRYTEEGALSTAPAFVGETNLIESVWRIITARALQIEVAFLPPLASSAFETRHQIAHAARAAMAAHLGMPTEDPRHGDFRLTWRPASPQTDLARADTPPEPIDAPATKAR